MAGTRAHRDALIHDAATHSDVLHLSPVRDIDESRVSEVRGGERAIATVNDADDDRPAPIGTSLATAMRAPPGAAPMRINSRITPTA